MTAIAYPAWLLDIVAPGQVYPSGDAIMRRAITEVRKTAAEMRSNPKASAS